ncbi:transposase [Microseira sp. BLCC-F43]|uniref:transposase n=1 Tax=Microseira sp. BLCC-F43 TaxID=3153602 RepID=UPI0035BB559F
MEATILYFHLFGSIPYHTYSLASYEPPLAIPQRSCGEQLHAKSKLDHVLEMLQNLIYHKLLPFRTVLMDSWYATKNLMQYIDKQGKIYYCPLKRNRLVDDTGGVENYQPIESLNWNETELEQGKTIKIKAFPKDKKVKLFRVIVSTSKTEYIATNDINQDATDAVQLLCDIGWKIEEFHRELKQLTGIESRPSRQASLQRNHIACAMLVWLRLKDLAYKTGQTVYQIKYGLLSNYLIQQLKHPSLAMSLA